VAAAAVAVRHGTLAHRFFGREPGRTKLQALHR